MGKTFQKIFLKTTRWGSVRFRLFVLFVLLSVGPVVFVSVLGYRMTRNIVIRQVTLLLNLHNRMAREEIFRYLEGAQKMLLPVVEPGSAPVKRLIGEIGRKDLARTLAQDPLIRNWLAFLRLSGYFDNVWITDSTLKPLVSLNPAALPPTGLTDAVKSSLSYLSIPGGVGANRFFVCVHPLKPKAGPAVGYVIGQIDHTRLSQRLLHVGNQFGNYRVYVIQPASTVLFCTDPAVSFLDKGIAAASDYPQARVERRDGERVIRVVQPLGILDWQVLSEIPYRKALADVLVFRRQIIFGILAMLVFLLLLSYLVSYTFTRPIQQLSEAARRIGQGHLDRPVVSEAGDELGTLASDLDEMRRRLKHYTENLEKLVNERTAELRQAQHQIIHQEKMASLGLMAAGIAHEIGNPLTAISSLVQMQLRRSNDPETVEALTTVREHIGRISKIVRELVDFSRTGSQEVKPTYVNEIIASTVGILKYDRRAKGVEFHFDLGRDLPPLMLVPDQLQQVLFNILVNALDALKNPIRRIEIRTHADERWVFIEISDTGTGIPEDHLSKIFEPFFTTKEVGKGTGLGLTVSYGIIKNFGGEIRVNSRPGQGTTFTILLPVSREQEVEHGSNSDR